MIERKNIVVLIEKFINREDISIANANKIESILLDDFEDEQEVQDVALMLASYRPGGGDFLYDADEIIRNLKRIIAKVS